MKTYTFETESFQARTQGQRKGLSLNGVRMTGPDDAVVEIGIFGPAELVDPDGPQPERRVTDNGELVLYGADATPVVTLQNARLSWALDANQHYSDVTLQHDGTLTRLETIGEEVVAGSVPSRKKLKLNLIVQ